jgi:hypothetical protein
MFTAGVLRDPMVALIDVLAIAGAVLLIRRSAPSGRAGGSGIGDAVPALGGKQAGA